MGGSLGLSTLPMPALVGIGLLVLVQIVLDVVSLVDLYKRPAAQVAFGRKWVWVLIILFVNTIGAILYLAIGRTAAPATEVTPASPTATRAADAADLLYGERTDADKR